jgi:hypothetical protein
MIRRVSMAAALVCTIGAVSMADTMKWDAAKALAAGTGKIIAVYSNVDAEGGSC